MTNEERWFSGWLKELEDYGMITDIEYQPEPFSLIPNWDVPCGGNKKNITLLTSIEYRPDFKFKIHESLQNKLFMGYECRSRLIFDRNPIGCNIPLLTSKQMCWVDTKGSFYNPMSKGNNSAITFPLKQAWVLQQYNIYVNKVTITQTPNKAKVKTRYKNNYKYYQNLDFFARTFYPNCYLYTDKGNDRKLGNKIKYSELGLKNVKQYLKQEK